MGILDTLFVWILTHQYSSCSPSYYPLQMVSLSLSVQPLNVSFLGSSFFFLNIYLFERASEQGEV